MTDRLTKVSQMIAKVSKKKGLSEKAAIEYMLIVATGRLAALWRYDDSLPEGKSSKGILTERGKKKRAPKSPKIAPSVSAEAAAAESPKKKRKPSKRKAKAKDAEVAVAAE